MIYVLDHDEGGARHPLTDDFLAAATPLLRLAGFAEIDAANAAHTEFTQDDCIVMCNPVEGATLDPSALRVLERAVQSGTTVKTVALEESRRRPPDPITDLQAFEVHDFQQRHSHKTETVGPVGAAFAREALASTLPTCYRDRPNLFLSYARADGEALARTLAVELRSDGLDVFRDLASIQSGDNADRRIDDALAASDALVLLETPRVCESLYISRELTIALERRLPIVWIRIDPKIDRAQDLAPEPSGEPAVVASSIEVEKDPGAFAADVVDQVFRSGQALVASMLDELRSLELDTSESAVQVEPLSRRLLIYEITAPGPDNLLGLSTTERHLGQFFGRRARRDDARLLEQWRHESFGSNSTRHTAAVLLDPLPGDQETLGSAVRKNAREYRHAVARPETDGSTVGPWLLLSGAFPDDTTTHVETKRAVADIAEEWFRLAGGIVMGGHPTFTPIVVGAASSQRPLEEVSRLRIFQSRHFPTDQSDRFSGRAHFTGVPEQVDRASSLTLMRRRMFQTRPAAAIFIGGRQPHGGDPAGVDEELGLARASGTPSVLLGAPGGRTAELVEDLDKQALTWKALATPNFEADFLEICAMRSDYRGIARELFARVSG